MKLGKVWSIEDTGASSCTSRLVSFEAVTTLSELLVCLSETSTFLILVAIYALSTLDQYRGYHNEGV